MIKRFFAVIFSVVIVLLEMQPVMAENKADVMLFKDDFEKYTDSSPLLGTYTADAYSRTQLSVETSDELHGKSARVGLSAEGDNTQMFYPLMQPIKGGRVKMNFSVNIGTNNLNSHIYCIDSETGDLFSLLYFDGEKIQVGTDRNLPADYAGSGVQLCYYKTNAWYDFEIILDIDNDYFNVRCTTPEEEDYTVFYRGVKKLYKDMGTNSYGEIEGLGQVVFQVWQHMDGYMYVDDFSLTQLPLNVTDVRTKRDGNIFRMQDDKQFDIDIKNSIGSKINADVTYSAVTDHGVKLFNETEKMDISGGDTYTKHLDFDMDVYDTAMLKVTIDDHISEPISEEFPFSCAVSSEQGSANEFFGMCSHDTRDGEDDMPERADMYSDFGIGYVREDFEWKTIEKDGVLKLPDHYKPFIKNLTDKGIKTLPILAFGNDAYDEGGLPYTKEGRAAFIRYAEFMYDELSPLGVDTYEIWNEADLLGTGFNPTNRPAEDYRELMKQTSAALKAKNPNITIIGGAIANEENETWLRTVFDDGGIQAMDALALHPYDATGGPEETNLIGRLERIKEIMREYGREIPIWVTELGWYNIERVATSEDNLVHTKYEQAAFPVRAYVLMQANKSAEHYFYYNFINPMANQNFTEAEFGMLEAEKGTLVPRAAKTSLLSISNMNKQLAGTQFDKLYTFEDTTYIGKYKKSNEENVYVAWTTEENESIGIKSTEEFTVYDMYGNCSGTVSPLNGVINLMISEEPCYLVSKEKDIEIVENTVSIDKTYAEAVRNDAVSYIVSAKGAQALSVQTEVSEGGNMQSSNNISDEKAEFTVKIDDNYDIKDITVKTKVFDSDKLIFAVAGNISIYPSQFEVELKAELYDYSNLNRWNVIVDITNKAYSKQSGGKITLNAPQHMAEYSRPISFPKLKGGEKHTVKIQLPEMVKKSVENCIVTVVSDDGEEKSASKNTSFYVAAYAKNKPSLDGKTDSGEWKGTWISVDGNNRKIDTENNAKASFVNERDLAAKVNLMWDEKNLYICADVTDNKFSQPFIGEDIDKGDSFVFAVDDTNSISSTQFTETGAALTKNGPQLFRWRSMARNNDVNEGSELFVKQYNTGRIVYEMKIPWDGLVTKPEEIVLRDTINLAFMVNDCDGNIRKGWAEFTSGISSYKNASMFESILLGKP